MSEEKHYGHYDPYGLDSSPNPVTGESWGGYYARHVSALTAENLHEKSEISAELGWRDLQIDLLRAENEALLGLLYECDEAMMWQLNGEPLDTMLIECRKKIAALAAKGE